MKLFFDTNVLLDYVIKRNDNHEILQSIVKSCVNKEYEGFVTSHSITDFFYIARKYFSDKERKELTEFIVNTFTILTEDKESFLNCLKAEHFVDLEDQLQMESARDAQLDLIITENLKDFEFSPIHAVSSQEFVKDYA